MKPSKRIQITKQTITRLFKQLRNHRYQPGNKTSICLAIQNKKTTEQPTHQKKQPTDQATHQLVHSWLTAWETDFQRDRGESYLR